MSDKFTLDVVQASELKHAFARNGWSNADVKRLCEGDALSRVREVLQREAAIEPSNHFMIDCDAAPVIYREDGMEVARHQKGGQLRFDPARASFFIDRRQKRSFPTGRQLQRTILSKPVLNANVLDYLYHNPHIIPEEWKRGARGALRRIHFWGTSYFIKDRGEVILTLECVSGGRFGYGPLEWRIGYSRVEDRLGDYCPAIIYRQS